MAIIRIVVENGCEDVACKTHDISWRKLNVRGIFTPFSFHRKSRKEVNGLEVPEICPRRDTVQNAAQLPM